MAVRHSKKTRDQLIAAYKEYGSVAGASRSIGICRFLHYKWMKTHPDYKAEFEEATEPVGDLIMEEIINRGMVGWIEPVFSGGKRALDYEMGPDGKLVMENGKPKAVPATIRKKSDACLLALAAARVPGFSQKAAGRQGTGKDPDGNDMEVTVVYKRKPIPTDGDTPDAE